LLRPGKRAGDLLEWEIGNDEEVNIAAGCDIATDEGTEYERYLNLIPILIQPVCYCVSHPK
jgi:hypothetical protein